MDFIFDFKISENMTRRTQIFQIFKAIILFVFVFMMDLKYLWNQIKSATGTSTRNILFIEKFTTVLRGGTSSRPTVAQTRTIFCCSIQNRRVKRSAALKTSLQNYLLFQPFLSTRMGTEICFSRFDNGHFETQRLVTYATLCSHSSSLTEAHTCP